MRWWNRSRHVGSAAPETVSDFKHARSKVDIGTGTELYNCMEEAGGEEEARRAEKEAQKTSRSEGCQQEKEECEGKGQDQ